MPKPSLARRLGRPTNRALATLLTPLTASERRVLRAFLVYPNDKTVALKLGKQTQTIRNQINAILQKLRVESRAELVSLVLRVKYRRRLPKSRRPPP